MNILITICARGGSKGIPRKNVKSLAGRPLLAYTIAHAKAFAARFDSDIALSTDDPEIKAVAADFGIVTAYDRPAALATDTTGKIPVLQHLVDYEQQARGKVYDYVLDLDVSAPMRTLDDLLQAFDVIQAQPDALNLFSVSKPDKNPYFNMVEAGEDGYYHLVKRKGNSGVESRQTAPQVFALNASFYFYSKAFFADGLPGAITDRSLIYEMPHLCFDLDHPLDWDFLVYLIEHQKIGFDL